MVLLWYVFSANIFIIARSHWQESGNIMYGNKIDAVRLISENSKGAPFDLIVLTDDRSDEYIYLFDVNDFSLLFSLKPLKVFGFPLLNINIYSKDW